MITGSTEKKIGRSTFLSEDQEKDLTIRIKRLAEIGMPIAGKVFTFCDKNKIARPFSKEKNGWAHMDDTVFKT